MSLLQEFLPSVIQNTRDARIYLADNASTDDSCNWVQNTYPQVEIVRMDKNRGFAGGYNYALKQITADIYVLINSDIQVTPNWLVAPLSQFNDIKIGAVQPKIKSYRERNKFEHAGAGGGYLDKLGFPFCRGRIFSKVEEDNGQYDNNVDIFWASGACLFIRSELFHKAGGFSEHFFAHMEEIDLCWRIQRMGYLIRFERHTEVFHLGGATLDYMSPRKAYLNFRNSLFMLYRNETGWVCGKIFYRMMWDGIAGFRFLIQGKPKLTLLIIKAHFHFYSAIRRLKKERKVIKNLGNNTPRGRYAGNMVVSHFIKHIHSFKNIDLSRFS